MSGDDISNSAGPGSAAEPSMEEILDSIRRIMREDGGPAAAPMALDEEVLVLDAAMIARPGGLPSGTAPPAAAETIEAPAAEIAGGGYVQPGHIASDPALTTAPDLVSGTLARPEEAMYIPADQPEPEMSDIQPPDSLIGDDASQAAKSSIGALVRSLSAERSVMVSRAGITLEDIVREEIRPMLKSWLDSHLPSLVERIVRAEIERVIDRTQV